MWLNKIEIAEVSGLHPTVIIDTGIVKYGKYPLGQLVAACSSAPLKKFIRINEVVIRGNSVCSRFHLKPQRLEKNKFAQRNSLSIGKKLPSPLCNRIFQF